MWSKEKVTVFAVTFFCYALFHVDRKTLSGVKQSVVSDWTSNVTEHGLNREPFIATEKEAKSFLGALDSVFMATYAVALIYWGWLGDRMNTSNLLVFGMITSAIMLTLFGSFPKFFDIYSRWYYIITYMLFGLFQACGWPSVVAIMANWFDENNRGFIMGIWTSCQSIGNIFGSLLIAAILHFGYEYTFLFNSSLMFFGSLIVAISIKKASNDDEEALNPNEDGNLRNRGFLSILDVLSLPNIIPYCICNVCLKFVNYAFFFWLPLYLIGKYGWSEQQANSLSAFFDVGGIIGSILLGVISDRFGYRSPVIVITLLIAILIIELYANIGGNPILNSLVMMFVGFTVSGPYNLISATIAIDIGSQPLISSNVQAKAAVCGIMDGFGSLGSAIGQSIIPIIESRLGWHYVFYLFIVMIALSNLTLFYKCAADIHASRLVQASNGRNVAETEPLLE